LHPLKLLLHLRLVLTEAYQVLLFGRDGLSEDMQSFLELLQVLFLEL